ncbi:hypothetical protein [Falsiroseomonas sp.]|uniref:hypothetical protein n=1 Tax=Falsiroseomonas sp. TaxID=2870721 RepID=UPI003567EA3B
MRLSGSALLLAIAAAAAVAAPTGGAEAAIFNVNRTIGLGGVSGTLTTDGTIGALATQNITDWNLVLSDGAATLVLTPANSQHVIDGQAFSATATQLVFDFAAPSGAALFQAPFIGAGTNYWCLEIAGCTGAGPQAESVYLNFTPPGVVATYATAQVIGTVVATVAEPAAFAIFGLGLVGLGILRRKRA